MLRHSNDDSERRTTDPTILMMMTKKMSSSDEEDVDSLWSSRVGSGYDPIEVRRELDYNHARHSVVSIPREFVRKLGWSGSSWRRSNAWNELNQES
jgi:hypothetical protein